MRLFDVDFVRTMIMERIRSGSSVDSAVSETLSVINLDALRDGIGQAIKNPEDPLGYLWKLGDIIPERWKPFYESITGRKSLCFDDTQWVKQVIEQLGSAEDKLNRAARVLEP